MRRLAFRGLWRHPDFLRFWAAQSISLLGSQVTLLALPFTAVLVLNASPIQSGILRAAQLLPYLLFGLFAGVWVDRARRRPLLVGADLGRAVLLITVPLAYVLDLLTLGQLFVVAFGVGALTLLFDVAYQSMLPTMLRPDQIIEGNSKLEQGRAVGQVAGPGIAGTLVQIANAPFAIAMDAFSFLISALLIGRIRAVEPPPKHSSERRGVWTEIGDGLRIVLRHPLLRPIVGCTATINFSISAFAAIVVLYETRVLGFNPGVIGATFVVGSIGGLLGAFAGGRIARRFGPGPVIVGAALLGPAGMFLIGVAGPTPPVAVAVVSAGMALTGFAAPLYNVNAASLRQTITPHAVMGRVNGTTRFISFSMTPLGSLLGGVAGEAIGLRAAVCVIAACMFAGFFWALLSPLRDVRELPAAP